MFSPYICTYRIRREASNAFIDGIYNSTFDSDNDTLYATRDTFERVLRRLMHKPGGRIRWISGTVTGLQKSEVVGENRVKSVSIRMESNEEQVIPASLVVGQLSISFSL